MKHRNLLALLCAGIMIFSNAPSAFTETLTAPIAAEQIIEEADSENVSTGDLSEVSTFADADTAEITDETGVGTEDFAEEPVEDTGLMIEDSQSEAPAPEQDGILLADEDEPAAPDEDETLDEPAAPDEPEEAIEQLSESADLSEASLLIDSDSDTAGKNYEEEDFLPMREGVIQQYKYTDEGVYLKLTAKTAGRYLFIAAFEDTSVECRMDMFLMNDTTWNEYYSDSIYGDEGNKCHIALDAAVGDDLYVMIYAGQKAIGKTVNVKGVRLEPANVTWYVYDGCDYNTITRETVGYRVSQVYPYLTNPYRKGYIFNGWGLSPDSTTRLFTNGSTYTLTGDTTFYALWKKNYSGTLIENKEQKITVSDKIGYYNFKFTPSATGVYHFTSYSPSDASIDPKLDVYYRDTYIATVDNENGKLFKLDQNLMQGETYDLRLFMNAGTNGSTFYIKAAPDKMVNVTWDANDGTFAKAQSGQIVKTMGAGAQVTGPENDTPSRDDLIWIGWALTPDAEEPAVDAEHPYTVKEDTTFYAVYTEAPDVALVSAVNGTSGIETSWKAEGDISSFILERREASTEWEQVAVTSELKYTDANVATGHIYWYRVLGVDAEGSIVGTWDRVGLRAAREFKDVPLTGKYYSKAVYWASAQGITKGYSKTNTFGPELTCTRADMVTFLWRLAGCPEPETQTNPFKDVSPKKYYYKPILWAYENGITKGYSKGYFKPGYECRRGDAVTFLWRMAGKPEPKTAECPYWDVYQGYYYTKAITWASENGIANGYVPDASYGESMKSFEPYESCKREHIVTFIYRYAMLQ